MSSLAVSSPTRWLVLNAIIVASVIGVGAYLIATNEEIAEVANEAFWGVFTFFTTPFILETTLALTAILLVGIINQRRIDREGDGWVVLPREPAEPSPDEAHKNEPEVL